MKIVIDTQIILWILFDSKKLSKEEIDIIQDPDNEIICCSISIFEISLKYSVGKLILNNMKPDKIPGLLLKNGYQIKESSYDSYATFYALPNDIHKDSFNRMIVWESIKNGYYLMTRDKEIKKYQKYGLKTV